MKAAISGETLGSVMELDEILSLFQKMGFIYRNMAGKYSCKSRKNTSA